MISYIECFSVSVSTIKIMVDFINFQVNLCRRGPVKSKNKAASEGGSKPGDEVDDTDSLGAVGGVPKHFLKSEKEKYSAETSLKLVEIGVSSLKRSSFPHFAMSFQNKHKAGTLC